MTLTKYSDGHVGRFGKYQLEQ